MFSCRKLLTYIYIPILQRELDIFKSTIWNNHRGRKQKNKLLPTGIPEHIYHFPELYGGAKCGIAISDQDLQEVTLLANANDNTQDYLEQPFRAECERHVMNINNIKSPEAFDAYVILKQNFNENNI